MATGLTSYKIYRSFRLEIPPVDPITFEITAPTNLAIMPRDLNLSGLSFYSEASFRTHQEIELTLGHISWFLKKTIKIKGFIVRKFAHPDNPKMVGHGVMIAKDDREKLSEFIESYINSFSTKRLKQYLTDSTLAEKSYSMADALEVYSLYLSLISDLSESVHLSLEEKLSLMREALKSKGMVVYLYDSETKSLTPENWIGDIERPNSMYYQEGLPGMTLGSGETFNFTSTFNKVNAHLFQNMPKVVSCLSTPIYNHKKEAIGVLQAVNKESSPEFGPSDEAAISLFARVIEQLYPNRIGVKKCELTHLLPGGSKFIVAAREAAFKLKETPRPTIITGEKGLSKTALAKWMHHNGQFSQYELVYLEGDQKEAISILSQIVSSRARATIVWKDLLLASKEFQTKAYALLRDHLGKCIFIERTLPSPSLTHWDAPLVHFMTRSHIHLPPLRGRSEDILPNANQLLLELCLKNSMPIKIFSKDSIERLADAPLTGNLAELREYIMKDFNAQLNDPVIDLLSLAKAPASPEILSQALVLASDTTLPLSKRMSLLKLALSRSERGVRKVS